MRAENLEQLAAKLGRPATGLSAFGDLTPEQISELGQLIDAARKRRHGEYADAFQEALPAPLRIPLLSILRRQ